MIKTKSQSKSIMNQVPVSLSSIWFQKKVFISDRINCCSHM